MSDLQIVLIVIGGIIIAGVLIFNWWQERKFHNQVEKNFSEFNQEAETAEPSLNTNGLQVATDKFDDDDFAIGTPSIKVENQANGFNEEYENDSLKNIDDFAQQSEPKFDDATIGMATDNTQPFSDSTPFDAVDVVSGAEPKSAKYNDIKAIIEGAFKNDASGKSGELARNNAPTRSDVSDEMIYDEALTSSEQPLIVEDSESAPPPIAPPSLPDALHSQVDMVALLYLQGNTSVTDVLNLLKDGFDGYEKPTFVHVQTNMGWLLLADITTKTEYANLLVSKISCAIQLADRAGPISRSVLNRFQLAVESLGLDLNAQVEWQSTSDALNDANALDQFCIEVDKTMGFHLLHGENGAFTGTKLRGLAESQGLELGSDGAFKYYDASVKAANSSGTALLVPSFVMFNRDHNPFSVDMLRSSVVKSITFQLDIPHVKNAIDAFNQMVQIAKQMETGLNAQLVDDNNRPLGDVQIEKIRHQLKIIQATMLTKGIKPGSDCAHRLFS